MASFLIFQNSIARIFLLLALTLFSPTTASQVSVPNAIETLQEVFLHETSESENSGARTRAADVFCDGKDPICKKFQMMLENDTKNASNALYRLRRSSDRNQKPDCDPSDPICKKYQIMFQNNQRPPQVFRSIDDGEDSTPLTSLTKPVVDNTNKDPELDCDRENPICQKFQALLRYQERERKRKPTESQPKPPSSGSSGQTPWCEFYCDFFLKKVCYSNGTCGDAVNEENAA